MTQHSLYAHGELTDGTNWDGLRVPLSTRIAFEKAAKHNNWNAEKDFATSGAFLSWHISRASGIHSLDWETFIATAIEADVTRSAPEGVTLQTGDFIAFDEDPTQTAPSTG